MEAESRHRSNNRKRRRTNSCKDNSYERNTKLRTPPSCDLLSLYECLTEGDPFPTIELTSDSEEEGDEDFSSLRRPGSPAARMQPVHSLLRMQHRHISNSNATTSGISGLRRCKTCISDLALLQATTTTEESSASMMLSLSSSNMLRPPRRLSSNITHVAGRYSDGRQQRLGDDMYSSRSGSDLGSLPDDGGSFSLLE